MPTSPPTCNRPKPGCSHRSGRKTATLITPIPLYHIFALTANCLLFLRLGWRNILIINPRDFPAVIAELKQYPFAFISGVNTLFNALLNCPGFDSVDFSNLQITLGGGMAVQRAVAERWKRVTGKVLTQAWGLTETSPAACINPARGGFQRVDRIADPVHPSRDQGRRGSRPPDRRHWARSVCSALR